MNTKSTDRWVTVAEAARLTGRPENSISNWYLTDKVVRHKRISARRVLVNLADCIEQSDARVRRRRKPTPMAVRVVPAVVVDLVPFSLAGQQCQGWRIDGEELLDAGLLGRLLDYSDRNLVGSIGGAWSDEFIDGEHFRIIDGPALDCLKRKVVGSSPTTSAHKYAPSITALTRAGVALVLLKTHKPIGVALRRALAGAHFMAELLDGNPEPMRQAVTAPSETAAILTMLGQQNQAMMQFFAQQAQESRAMMQTLLEAVQTRKSDSVVINVGGKPEVITDPADCRYTKEKIVSLVHREFPAVNKWSQISKPARDLGIITPECFGGTHGMAEYRRAPDAQWPRIFLSWAFKEWACDHFRGVGYIHIPA
jgi:hypothetical protein